MTDYLNIAKIFPIFGRSYSDTKSKATLRQHSKCFSLRQMHQQQYELQQQYF